MTLQPATTITTGDLIALKVRVKDVSPSDHGYYGLHDIINLEVVDADGDLPVGLDLQIRRPHDGTTDLRSHDRKTRAANRPAAGERSLKMLKKAELQALVAERRVPVPDDATRGQMIAALNGETRVPDLPDDLGSLKKTELIALAESRHVTVDGKATKAQIVHALTA